MYCNRLRYCITLTYQAICVDLAKDLCFQVWVYAAFSSMRASFFCIAIGSASAQEIRQRGQHCTQFPHLTTTEHTWGVQQTSPPMMSVVRSWVSWAFSFRNVVHLLSLVFVWWWFLVVSRWCAQKTDKKSQNDDDAPSDAIFVRRKYGRKCIFINVFEFIYNNVHM